MRGPIARHRLSAARLYCYTRLLFVALHIPSTETLSMWLLYLLGVALLGLVAVGTGTYLAMLLSSPKFAQEVLEFLHLPPTFLQSGHCSPHGPGSFCSVSGRAAKYAVFCSARGLFSFSFPQVLYCGCRFFVHTGLVVFHNLRLFTLFRSFFDLPRKCSTHEVSGDCGPEGGSIHASP